MAKSRWKISLALILSGMLAVSALQAAHASGRSTKVTRFAPRSPGRGLIKGYCWSGSIAIDRPDAWRCMAGNEIYDPCFEYKDKGFVVCDPNPIKGDPGVRMKLTKPLPRSKRQAAPESERGAWLVELADGTACSQRTGAGWLIKGKPVNYYCASGKKGIEIDLVGQFDTSKPIWTVEKAIMVDGAAGPKLVKMERAPLKRVWR